MERIKSGLMLITIDGSTIRYTYKPSESSYELRDMPPSAINALRQADREKRAGRRSSVSATVMYLAHEYPLRHYHAGGDMKADPPSQSQESLRPMTPFR